MSAKMRSRAICLFAFAITSLRAEDGPWDRQSLLAGLVEDNPEIQAALFRFEAATKRPSQAGTLPEPTARYTNFGVGHPFSPLNATEFAYHGFGVSQEIPFPGKLGLASEEAKREAESEEQNYRALVLEAMARLKVPWYEWLAVQKAIELTR